MNPPPEHLPEILGAIWDDLAEAVRVASHPFHTLAFSTVSISPEGTPPAPPRPRTRTVVLRHADGLRGELVCHTDLRSEKSAELHREPVTAWHGYAAERKIQLRFEGTTTIHHGDELARQAWDQANLSSRRTYLSPLGPGTVVTTPQSGLPAHLQGRVPTEEESRPGWDRFAVLVTRVEKIEWLYLAATGHRRACFLRQENSFAGSWLIP